MYFYEAIQKCDINELVSYFLKLCKNSPDINHTEKCIRSALSDMKSIQAIKSEHEIIKIETKKGLPCPDKPQSAG